MADKPCFTSSERKVQTNSQDRNPQSYPILSCKLKEKEEIRLWGDWEVRTYAAVPSSNVLGALFFKPIVPVIYT